MKKQKLYIKNEKGRYEEYKPESKLDDCDLMFRKRGGRYYPCSRHINTDSLSEGVWVVLSNLSYCSKSISNCDYLKKLFQIHKVSGIEEVTIAQLGGLEKYYDYVASEWNKYYHQYMLGHELSPSNSEAIHFIIGKVFEYSKMKNMRKNISEWISTEDDLPCNHDEMVYRNRIGEGMFTENVIVRTEDGSIFMTDMRRQEDGSFLWNISDMYIITHWMKIPKFDLNESYNKI